MLSVTQEPIRVSTTSPTVVKDMSLPGDMDHLLTQLRRNMVELILQGDDVTRQMWKMYSVFEEIFGIQKISSKPQLKQVVVGDKIKQKMSPPPAVSQHSPVVANEDSETNVLTLASPSTANGATTITSTVVTTTTITATTTVSCSSSSTATIVTSCPTTVSSPVVSVSSDDAILKHQLPNIHPEKRIFTRNKVNQRSVNNEGSPMTKSEINRQAVQSSTISVTSPITTASQETPRVPPTTNPLLDTIGALTGSNPDSDDSDLDIVYQQLRYRGRHRRPEQGRLRTQRSQRHHHQHFASSDPESTSYAGSNSIDSGYKSQCATPEVSDSLSAPEVRRSASDVSASDSSTTSGRPRSSDGMDSKSVKIKMGTRVIAGKIPPGSTRRQPLLESSMSDVTLDHLMYLRQSMRKDRQDYLPSSSHGSIPSSSASSTIRDELSPTIFTDEESVYPEISRVSPNMNPRQQRSDMAPIAYSPTGSPTFLGASSRSSQGPRTGRRMSAGNEPIPEASGGSSSSSDFLLSGVEYYDLDSVHDFPQRRSYFSMLEEKTRCSRIHLMAASKRELQTGKLDPFLKKKKDLVSRAPPSEPNAYGMTRHMARETVHRSHPNPTSRGSDSKLTEAAIRVLEMIEDFRMEEAIENATALEKADARDRLRPSVSVTSVGPHAFVPRFRRTSGSRSAMRPASTGSLMSSEIIPVDARSVASSSSYAASAEHHVYEEIMYDLVCERASRGDHPMPIVAHSGATKSRNRFSPVNAMTASSSHSYQVGPERARMTVRSHKHRGNFYSVIPDEDSRSSDHFIEMEWNIARGRRDNLPSDYPI